MRLLELLAPARDKRIGIAAIDCGADAVYIAGPAFGARAAAGNSIEDIADLCRYASLFGARIFVTLNTIIYENELEEALDLMKKIEEAGADALIVQDPAVIMMARRSGIRMAMHASTQCAIRTPQKAVFYESMGFGRLVLERQMSLDQIKAIRAAVKGEIEFFVHGALCVCYSGQCYMSEAIERRSANRGECIQACRSLYDLADSSGKILLRNKALLSLKDYNLLSRLEDLVGAGVDSFKIEGRLKSETYVKNAVLAYSRALDEIIVQHPDIYRRASFGRVKGGFEPNLEKTFNRGYTELFLDGKRGKWSSMDAPKSIGEPMGKVARILRRGDKMTVTLSGERILLSNGDGFSFIGHNSKISGFRGDIASWPRIEGKDVPQLREGMILYRNIDAAFEKGASSAKTAREIAVVVDIDFSEKGILKASSTREDGEKVTLMFPCPRDEANDIERMASILKGQIEKRSENYCFSLGAVEGKIPMMGASFINSVRRAIADAFKKRPIKKFPLQRIAPDENVKAVTDITYKDDVTNSLSRDFYYDRGAKSVEEAFELTHRKKAELMRTKYCIRYELGLCPIHQGAKNTGELFLLNNGRRFRLGFDCKACEMTVAEA